VRYLFVLFVLLTVSVNAQTHDEEETNIVVDWDIYKNDCWKMNEYGAWDYVCAINIEPIYKPDDILLGPFTPMSDCISRKEVEEMLRQLREELTKPKRRKKIDIRKPIYAW